MHLLLLLSACSPNSPVSWSVTIPALQMQGRMEESKLILEDPQGSLELETMGWGRGQIRPFSGTPTWGEGRPGEWWHRFSSGFEQGWTLTERPEGSGPLVIQIGTNAEVAMRGGDADLLAPDGSRWIYAGVQAEDADGRLLSASLEGEDGQLRVVVDDASARYPLRVDPVVTTAASTINGSNYDSMGQGIAGGDVDGDGYSDWLIGADRVSARGAVYLYKGSKSGIGATPDATLYPATSGYDGFFGWEIRTGDFNKDGYADVAVSEPYYNNGTVYVFNGSKTGLNTIASFVVAGATQREQNGFSMAVGDFNADGYDDLAVANPYRNTYGGADIYSGGTNGLSTTSVIKIEMTSSFKKMGYSADSADVNGDGYDDLLLSHYEASSYYGAVYIFEGSASGPPTSASITIVGPQYDVAFGREVANLGDINNDGYDDIGVGAVGIDLPHYNSGAMYVYNGAAAGPSTTASATLYGTGYGDYFGWAIEGLGDTNGDGYDDVAVGSTLANGGTYASGNVRVIPGSASGLSTADEDTVYGGTTPYENYGATVARVGDINGDGFMDLGVGHPDHNSRGGSAYLYFGTDGTIDDDGDGFFTSGGNSDCDDTDASIHPGATEVCDGVDQDCDGTVDDGVSTMYFADSDGDSYGDANTSQAACATPTGYVTDDQDCNDLLASVNPAALEGTADLVDQNCDGLENCYLDADKDSYGISSLVSSKTLDCSGSGESANASDCDDTVASTYPSATEVVADGIDQDCDGGDRCYADTDLDGVGSGTVDSSDLSCLDKGESTTSGDCDDTNNTIFPGAPETLADGVDQDCDGQESCYMDADGDLYGSSAVGLSQDLDCLDAFEAATAGDCNDLAPTIHPGGVEIPVDGVDEDCDGGDLCYVDGDNDDFGSSALTASITLDCSGKYEAIVNTDCDDSNATIYPDALEQAADGIDESCDGEEVCYVDLDGDTVGSTDTVHSTNLSCTDKGTSARWSDCDDNDATRNPDVAEIPADGIDSDCDEEELCYDDGDKDSFGSATTHGSSRLGCDAAGDSNESTDCDDTNPDISPSGIENAADGVDSDCDGQELCFEDEDGDGHGVDRTILSADLSCGTDGAPAADDCDDKNPDISPSAPEIPADGVDEDCNGGESCYIDGDGDSYGSGDLGESVNLSCTESGEATSNADCDDAEVSSFPGAAETCNSRDDNCDGNADEGLECDTKETGATCSHVSAPGFFSLSPLLLGLLLRRRR